MNLSVLMKLHKDKYQALQAAKWLQKNLKTVEEDITAFEDYMNVEHQKMINKCSHCKIEMKSFSHTAVECPKCGLADTKKGYYHEPSQNFLESPLKQTFDHEKYFVKWINNILRINTPKKDILPTLRDYVIKNNIPVSIETLRLALKQLKLAQYYKYASYFYKELTGVELPFIPHNIINRAKWYFTNFYKARERLVVEGKLPKNNP